MLVKPVSSCKTDKGRLLCVTRNALYFNGTWWDL